MRRLLRPLLEVEVAKEPPKHLALRLAYGAKMPFALARAMLRDPVLGPRFRRHIRVQLIVTGVLGALLTWIGLNGANKALDLGAEVGSGRKSGIHIERTKTKGAGGRKGATKAKAIAGSTQRPSSESPQPTDGTGAPPVGTRGQVGESSAGSGVEASPGRSAGAPAQTAPDAQPIANGVDAPPKRTGGALAQQAGADPAQTADGVSPESTGGSIAAPQVVGKPTQAAAGNDASPEPASGPSAAPRSPQAAERLDASQERTTRTSAAQQVTGKPTRAADENDASKERTTRTSAAQQVTGKPTRAADENDASKERTSGTSSAQQAARESPRVTAAQEQEDRDSETQELQSASKQLDERAEQLDREAQRLAQGLQQLASLARDSSVASPDADPKALERRTERLAQGLKRLASLAEASSLASEESKDLRRESDRLAAELVRLTALARESAASDTPDSAAKELEREANRFAEEIAKQSKRLERAQKRVEREQKHVERDQKKLERDLDRLERDRERQEQREEQEREKEKESPTLAFLAMLWGLLKAADWVVAALFFEHNDALTRQASEALGAHPEEGPEKPRVKLSIRWVAKRVLRQLSGAMMMLCALPVLLALVAVPKVGNELSSLGSALWAFYWVAVLTTAKTGAAWPEASERDPWFLRGLSWVAARAPVFKWMPRVYLRVVRRFSRKLTAPATTFERSPVQLIGLTLVRAVVSLPLVSIIFRPVLPLAAGYLVVGRPFTEASPATQR